MAKTKLLFEQYDATGFFSVPFMCLNFARERKSAEWKNTTTRVNIQNLWQAIERISFEFDIDGRYEKKKRELRQSNSKQIVNQSRLPVTECSCIITVMLCADAFGCFSNCSFLVESIQERFRHQDSKTHTE